jgi:hypothetical protein
MTKHVSYLVILFLTSTIFLSSCTQSPKLENGGGIKNAPQSTVNTPGQVETKSPEPEPVKTEEEDKPAPEAGQSPAPSIDLEKIKPNEAGKIMVVMFHNFVESYKSGDKAYTTTFDDFRKLLQTLYDKDYRLVSLSDYLNNNIEIQAGCIPIVFTFDDGTPGQFNLVEEDGKLAANKQSAVGIMEEFNKTHPDFGLKGVFYVNLGLGTFPGKGTVDERLKYLIDKGFEIGNHTLTHVNLKKVTTVEKILQEIGGNQKKMGELVPEYKMTSFSLPFGAPSKDLQEYVAKGEFEGVSYQHLAIMEVGWDPAPSPVSKKFNPLSTHRVRSSGIEPVDADLAWWLGKLSRAEQYVSDGDPNTVTLPIAKEESIDKSRLGEKKLITY